MTTAAEPELFNKKKQQVSDIVKEVLDKALKDKQYAAKDGPGWAHQISEEVVRRLPEVSKEFKYSVTCIILNKSEGGLHMSSSCYWNATTDGNHVEKWENDNMYCIVSVFGFGN